MGPRNPSTSEIKVMNTKTGSITEKGDKATHHWWKLDSMTMAFKYLNKQTCWEKLFEVTRIKKVEQMETTGMLLCLNVCFILFQV